MRNIEIKTREEFFSSDFIIGKRVKRTTLLSTLPSLMMIALSACGGGGGGSGGNDTSGDNSYSLDVAGDEPQDISDTGGTDTLLVTNSDGVVDDSMMSFELVEDGLNVSYDGKRLATVANWDAQDSKIEKLEVGGKSYDLSGYTFESGTVVRITDLTEIIDSGGDTGGGDTGSGGGDDTSGDNSYSLDVAGDEPQDISDTGGTDTLIVTNSDGVVDDSMMSFELVEGALHVSYDGKRLATIANWEDQDSKIEKLEVGGKSYDLSGYTFASGTVVRITDLTEITDSGSDTSGDNSYSLDVAGDEPQDISDTGGTDTLLVTNSDGVVDDSMMSFELVEDGLNVSYDGKRLATIANWDAQDSKIEKLEVGGKSYDLSGYTFASGTVVRITDLTEITDSGSDTSGDNSYSLDVAGDEPQDISDTGGTDTLIVTNSDGVVDDSMMSFELALHVSYDGKRLATVANWDAQDSKIEKLEVGGKSYDLSGYTFASGTVVRITDLTEITDPGSDTSGDNSYSLDVAGDEPQDISDTGGTDTLIVTNSDGVVDATA